ncbi:MAG: tetratricopeptide repeat protein [Lachnospiraceae bacterium]|nr:tetratricopeptide repeat protein [Lachnospiraceae bacterium]
MKCYACGNRLNELDYCPTCKADVRLYKKIISNSNALYNDGLEKARVRDLSGAAQSLRQSLKYDKKNINARNLLGLVYFEMGESVLALSEWIISKNYESKKNIADDYINILSANQNKLDTINQTLKKYNQALQYCYQDTRDLAEIQLKKVLSINKNLISAYQLLALIYIDNGDYSKARRILLKSLSIDATNTRSRYYLLNVNEALKDIAEHSSDKKKRQDALNTISYQSGNDTIIQPALPKERVGMSSIINIILGLLVGIAICWFLVLPARIENETEGYDKQYKLVSEELAAEKSNSQEREQILTQYETKLTEYEDEINYLKGSNGVMNENDYLMKAASEYLGSEDASSAVIDNLTNISEEYLQGANPSFVELYNILSQNAGSNAISKYVADAKTAMRQNDYTTAIDNFSKAWNLHQDDPELLMSLAHAYRESGDINKANELYTQVMNTFPESQAAIDAGDYITE